MSYRLIENGKVIAAQIKEFDGNQEMNSHRIADDIYGDGMDPLKQAMDGGPVRWVEGREVP